MKKIVLNVMVSCLFAQFATAQTDAFFVPTASAVNKWYYKDATFDKAGKGKAILAKFKKDFGVATSLWIDSTNGFDWIITTANGSSSTPGTITEIGDDCIFTFSDKKKFKVSPSFREYNTEMYLTIYGKTKKEFVTLKYTAKEY